LYDQHDLKIGGITLNVGVIVLGTLPAGVKQILFKLSKEMSPQHKLIGLEVAKDEKVIYRELNELSDSPYLGNTYLKLSVADHLQNWEELFINMDVAIVIGDQKAKAAWEEKLSDSEKVCSLFVPVSIHNNIKGSDWSLGYDTALNSITQNVLKVKDTIHSLKYDKPRLFGFSIEGHPPTSMLQDIAISVDGHFLANDLEDDEVKQLINTITQSFNHQNTSNVLLYSNELANVVEKEVVNKIDADWKYAEIDEALCMGTNPTAIDRILANELAEAILLWAANEKHTGQLKVLKDGINFNENKIRVK
jgi:6-phosphofructokinase 1